MRIQAAGAAEMISESAKRVLQASRAGRHPELMMIVPVQSDPHSNET